MLVTMIIILGVIIFYWSRPSLVIRFRVLYIRRGGFEDFRFHLRRLTSGVTAFAGDLRYLHSTFSQVYYHRFCDRRSRTFASLRRYAHATVAEHFELRTVWTENYVRRSRTLNWPCRTSLHFRFRLFNYLKVSLCDTLFLMNSI